jgi:hypothetical protein
MIPDDHSTSKTQSHDTEAATQEAPLTKVPKHSLLTPEEN